MYHSTKIWTVGAAVEYSRIYNTVRLWYVCIICTSMYERLWKVESGETIKWLSKHQNWLSLIPLATASFIASFIRGWQYDNWLIGSRTTAARSIHTINSTAVARPSHLLTVHHSSSFVIWFIPVATLSFFRELSLLIIMCVFVCSH